MDYSHIYDKLIEKATGRLRPQGYTERHHILPRCMGGLDTKNNLVRLTAREHLLAHRLLDKIYPGNRKLFFALWSMLTMKNSDMPRIQNSREYERAKIRLSIHMSNIQTGLKRPPRTPEHTAKIVAANTGRISSEETKDKIREARKLQICSIETRAKLSAAGSGENNPFFGKTHSAESRSKISENNASSKKVSCDGVIYNSMVDAAKAFDLKEYYVIKERCISPKWPTWHFIDDSNSRIIDTVGHKVSIDGIIYVSIAGAARALGFGSDSTVKKRCLSEKYPNWFLVC